jgi:adenylate kinase family enzyme
VLSSTDDPYLGCPGAGKGTLCKKLAAKYNGCHLSVGDTLRATVQDEHSIERAELAPYIRNGTLVPTDLLIKILNRILAQDASQTRRSLMLDSFPRRLQQSIEVESEEQTSSSIIF